MGRLFGTDGVRGIAGTELTADLARGLGRAAVPVLAATAGHRPCSCRGRDPRESGMWLEEALVEGIHEAGGDVVLAGVEPTPAVAFLTIDTRSRRGRRHLRLPQPARVQRHQVLRRRRDEAARRHRGRDRGDPPGSGAGDRRRGLDPGAQGRAGAVPGASRGGRRSSPGRDDVVVDCANGAASKRRARAVRRLGATVHAIHASPDGRNINVGCGALHPEVAGAAVVRARRRRRRLPRRRCRPGPVRDHRRRA